MTSMTTLERTAADRVRKSQALRERAMKVLARGHQGHRNPHDTLSLGGPGYASRSLGSRIWDVDGNEYIDYVMSFGPIVLGHADPEFNEAITRRIARGTVTSIQEADEVELAEALVERVPSAEMASLFIGGSSACLAALRYARASTGKTMAIKCGYHGWLDWSGAGGEGIPSRVSDLTIEVKYNDLEAIEAAFEAHPSDIAAVFIESVQDDGPREGYFDGGPGYRPSARRGFRCGRGQDGDSVMRSAGRRNTTESSLICPCSLRRCPMAIRDRRS